MKPKFGLVDREKVFLFWVIGATALLWMLLIVLLIDFYGLPGTGQPSVAHASTQQIPVGIRATFTPTWTPVPLETDPIPSATATALPSATPTVTPTPAGAPVLDLGKDTMVFVLLGIDEKHGAGVWRTDSIMLGFVQLEPKRISLLSLPRDLWVHIPGHGYDRINTVDALGERSNYPGGGPALLSETLYYNLGVSVDHYLRVDFQGFVDIVDALGGVTVNVEKPLTDTFPDPLSPTGSTTISFEPGPVHMGGHLALGYCRSRITTDDFDRSRRQQEVLKALWQQTFTPKNLSKAPELWKTLSGAFETDLEMVEMVVLATQFQGIDPDRVQSERLGFNTAKPWTTPQGAQVLLPQTEAIQQIILELLAKPVSSP